LGDEDGVIVFDPSAFPKSGRESVGVARQWSGRLGKVDDCQVAVTSNTLVRDLEVDPPPYCGRGRKPNRRWTRVDQWAASHTDKRQEGHEDLLVVIQYKDLDDYSVVKTDFRDTVLPAANGRCDSYGLVILQYVLRHVCCAQTS